MTLYAMKLTHDEFVERGSITEAQSVHLGRYYVSFDPVHGPTTTDDIMQACRFVDFQQAIDAIAQVSDPAVAEFTTLAEWAYYDPESTEEKPEPYRPLIRYSMDIEPIPGT